MANTTELNVAILRAHKTKKYLAEKLELSEAGFANKVNNISEFKASEIALLQAELSLSDSQRDAIFFVSKCD